MPNSLDNDRYHQHTTATQVILLSETIPLLTCLGVAIALTLVTIGGKEAWPFSCYPMFALYRDPPFMRYYFLQFLAGDGTPFKLLDRNSSVAEAFHYTFDAAWADVPSIDKNTPSRNIAESYLQRWASCDPQLNQVKYAQVMVRIAMIPHRDSPIFAEHSLGTLQVPEILTPS